MRTFLLIIIFFGSILQSIAIELSDSIHFHLGKTDTISIKINALTLRDTVVISTFNMQHDTLISFKLNQKIDLTSNGDNSKNFLVRGIEWINEDSVETEMRISNNENWHLIIEDKVLDQDEILLSNLKWCELEKKNNNQFYLQLTFYRQRRSYDLFIITGLRHLIPKRQSILVSKTLDK